MRLIITGCTAGMEYSEFIDAADKYQLHYDLAEIVLGRQDHISSLAVRFADEVNCPITFFHPDRDTYGRLADTHRWLSMIEYSDAIMMVYETTHQRLMCKVDVAVCCKERIPIYYWHTGDSAY